MYTGILERIGQAISREMAAGTGRNPSATKLCIDGGQYEQIETGKRGVIQDAVVDVWPDNTGITLTFQGHWDAENLKCLENEEVQTAK